MATGLSSGLRSNAEAKHKHKQKQTLNKMKTTLCTLTLAMNLATGLSSGLRSNAMGASATPYSSGICDESTPGKHEDGYRGCQTKTVSGNTCQKWTVQRYPGQHTRTPGNYPGKGLGDHNNCRNPDDEPNGIWCYTTNPNKRWEYCDPVHHTHAEYLAHLAAHENAAADAADEIAEHEAAAAKAFMAKVRGKKKAKRIAKEHGDAINDLTQAHEDAAADAADEIAEHEADKATARTEVARIAQELRTIAGYPEQLRTIAGEVANLIPEDEPPTPSPAAPMVQRFPTWTNPFRL